MTAHAICPSCPSYVQVLFSLNNILLVICYAAKSVHGIRGLEVTDMTARVDSKTGKIQEYRVCVKLSFGVKR